MMTVEEACIEDASLYEKPSDYKALLHSFGLSELKKSYINKLSGGEKTEAFCCSGIDWKSGDCISG